MRNRGEKRDNKDRQSEKKRQRGTRNKGEKGKPTRPRRRNPRETARASKHHTPALAHPTPGERVERRSTAVWLGHVSPFFRGLRGKLRATSPTDVRCSAAGAMAPTPLQASRKGNASSESHRSAARRGPVAMPRKIHQAHDLDAELSQAARSVSARTIRSGAPGGTKKTIRGAAAVRWRQHDHRGRAIRLRRCGRIASRNLAAPDASGLIPLSGNFGQVLGHIWSTCVELGPEPTKKRPHVAELCKMLSNAGSRSGQYWSESGQTLGTKRDQISDNLGHSWKQLRLSQHVRSPLG